MPPLRSSKSSFGLALKASTLRKIVLELVPALESEGYGASEAERANAFAITSAPRILQSSQPDFFHFSSDVADLHYTRLRRSIALRQDISIPSGDVTITRPCPSLWTDQPSP